MALARSTAKCFQTSRTRNHRSITLAEKPFHHFTVDVEEYFQVSALERAVPRDRWPSMPSRVCGSMELLLHLMEGAGAKGTFFVLGVVAEAHPHLVRRIAAMGHEVASHGWGHRRITTLGPDEFRDSVRRSRLLLQNLSGQEVLGYRAPSFSITRGREWALDILLEEGYQYDSSLFPIRRPGYGHPGAPVHPAWLERPAGRILEVPPMILRLPGLRVPAAGGAYFRLMPSSFVRTAFKQHERNGVPGTFYIHPWELDPEQPRLNVGFLTRIRHYGGLARTAPRLRGLLQEFRFLPIARTLNARSPAS